MTVSTSARESPAAGPYDRRLALQLWRSVVLHDAGDTLSIAPRGVPMWFLYCTVICVPGVIASAVYRTHRDQHIDWLGILISLIYVVMSMVNFIRTRRQNARAGAGKPTAVLSRTARTLMLYDAGITLQISWITGLRLVTQRKVIYDVPKTALTNVTELLVTAALPDGTVFDGPIAAAGKPRDVKRFADELAQVMSAKLTV